MNNSIATYITETFITDPIAVFYKDESKTEVGAITWRIRSTNPPDMWDCLLHLTDTDHIAIETLGSSIYPQQILEEALFTRYPHIRVSL